MVRITGFTGSRLQGLHGFSCPLPVFVKIWTFLLIYEQAPLPLFNPLIMYWDQKAKKIVESIRPEKILNFWR
jgi:hypothetical protein